MNKKSLISLTLLLTFFFSAHSQSNFPDIDAWWKYYCWDDFGNNHYPGGIYHLHDTTHWGGYVWNQIYSVNYINAQETYVGLVREDSSRKVFHRPLTGAVRWLYDFNVNIGDTLKGVYTEIIGSVGHIDTLVCTGKVLVSGNRYQYSLSPIGIYSGYFYNWLEGAGSLEGDLLVPTVTPLVSGTCALGCFTDNGLEIYNRSWCGPLAANVPENINITISPNPARNYLRINNHENNVSSGSLHNIQGEILKSWRQIPAQIEIEDLPPGIYLIRIDVSGKIWTGRFMKT